MTTNQDIKGTDQSFEKLKAYFLQIIIEDLFLQKVTAIRIKCGIPEEGYMDPEMDKRRSHLKEPKVWPTVYSEATQLATEYNLGLPFWIDLFADFITDNRFDFKHVRYSSGIQIRDIPQEKDGIKDNLIWQEYSEMEDQFYPICLMLNPHISRRDLEDYIRNNWSSMIEPALKKHLNPTSRIGKYRFKPSAKINEFIFDQQHHSLKEIQELIIRYFDIYLDVGHIGKVISNENKRRKEV